MNYDLEDRTKKFSKEIISLLKRVKKDEINRNIISQLIRSATSIGANYCEANNASSKKDFRNKIHICKKETQESKHWLHMISVAYPDNTKKARTLWQEAQELTLIFGKIISTLKN